LIDLTLACVSKDQALRHTDPVVHCKSWQVSSLGLPFNTT